MPTSKHHGTGDASLKWMSSKKVSAFHIPPIDVEMAVERKAIVPK
jgi:hypothetical protein